MLVIIYKYISISLFSLFMEAAPGYLLLVYFVGPIHSGGVFVFISWVELESYACYSSWCPSYELETAFYVYLYLHINIYYCYSIVY